MKKWKGSLIPFTVVIIIRKGHLGEFIRQRNQIKGIMVKRNELENLSLKHLKRLDKLNNNKQIF